MTIQNRVVNPDCITFDSRFGELNIVYASADNGSSSFMETCVRGMRHGIEPMDEIMLVNMIGPTKLDMAIRELSCREVCVPLRLDAHPKNKPHYRQIGRNNRY